MRRVCFSMMLVGLMGSNAVVRAETVPPKSPPPAKIITVPTTPERVIADLEAAAKRRKEKGPSPIARGFNFRIGLPDSAAEFASLRGYSVMLLTVLSQKTEEFPVRRVYIQSGGMDINLQRLSSWRSELDSKFLAAEVYGRYREDGFYLVPVGPMTREGIMALDMTPTGVTIRMVKLPSQAALNRKFAQPDALPSDRPDARALRDIIQRKFPGFPLPNIREAPGP